MSAPRTYRIDDFNRSNQGPAPSSSWTNGITTFTGGLVVLNNQLARQATGVYRQGSYWNPATFGPDCEVYGTVRNSSKSTADGMRLCLRLINIGSGSTDGYGLEVDYNGTSSSWSIGRFDNGATTTLTSAIVQNVSDGDQVLFQAYGSTLTGSYGSSGSWVDVVSLVDSTYGSAGYIGVELLRAQTWRLDEFSGGSFPVSGVVNVTVR